MTRPSSLPEIVSLYAARGHSNYGEGVTQLEHALQCASLAERGGAPASLIAAALLHDVGHLLETDETLAQSGVDDRHEANGARVLAALFAESVWKPVAMHVAAKRYLCFAEPSYYALLSPASKLSLDLQGGVFDQGQAQVFEKAPYWRDAVILRRLDDMGKRDDVSARAFTDYLPLLQNVLI